MTLKSDPCPNVNCAGSDPCPRCGGTMTRKSDTMTVMQPCEHGIYAPHYLDGPSNRVCPGGKEIRLQACVCGCEMFNMVEVDGND